VIMGAPSFEQQYPAQLEAQVAALGLGEHVTIMGNIPPPKVATWLRAADVFALGTAREGCCNAVLEALATGLPVVTTPHTCGPDVIEPGKHGWIVPIRDSQAIAERLAEHGGAGLFIDYGHLKPGVGDTLQALRKHDYEDVLANPGEADLTAHVDFAALAAIVRTHGLDAQLTTQGEFLLGMGLLERAGLLGAQANEQSRQTIAEAVERLAGPDAMGELFKVLRIQPKAAG